MSNFLLAKYLINLRLALPYLGIHIKKKISNIETFDLSTLRTYL